MSTPKRRFNLLSLTFIVLYFLETCLKILSNLTRLKIGYNKIRGSPIPLLKIVSRISNWPFHASRKMQKPPSRSQKKAGNHVSRRNASAKSY